MTSYIANDYILMANIIFLNISLWVWDAFVEGYTQFVELVVVPIFVVTKLLYQSVCVSTLGTFSCVCNK